MLNKRDFGLHALLLAIALLLLANVVVLNRALLTKASQATEKIAETLSGPKAATFTCDIECQRLIEDQVFKVVATFSAQPKKDTPVLPPPPPQVKSTPNVTYIPLGSSAITASTDWVKFSGSDIEFDLKDYSSSAKVFWEGNLKTGSEQSRCYARLFDKTHGRGVDFSEQSTNRTEFEYLKSQALSIWAGRNKYYIEFKSLNGVSCYLESPKLIIQY